MSRKQFWVRVPKSNVRAKFTILSREGRTATVVKLPRLDVLNSAYQTGTIDFESAKTQVYALKDELLAAERIQGGTRYPIADVNRDLFDNYWRESYLRRKIDPDSKRSAKNSFQRALSAIGALPLHTSNIIDLQVAVDRLEPKRQRIAASRINSLMKFINRKERINLVDVPSNTVHHVTAPELEALCTKLPDDKARLVVRVAFHTGLRLGELFAADRMLDLDRCVHVGRQMKVGKGGTITYGKTKTGGERFAAVSPKGVRFVQDWLKVGEDERRKLRLVRWSDVIHDAAKEAFPSKPSKWITFHDLRHSYAIFALSSGVPLDLVAMSLGNSIAVCQRYYTGFKVTSEIAQLIKMKWSDAA